MNLLDQPVLWKQLAMLVIGGALCIIAVAVADLLVEAWSRWRREKGRMKRRKHNA